MFTYTIKNILLIAGIILSVFLRTEKQLQSFECPVKLYVLSSDQNVCSLLLAANKSPRRNQIQVGEIWEQQ
jgi:hypothetical protein